MCVTVFASFTYLLTYSSADKKKKKKMCDSVRLLFFFFFSGQDAGAERGTAHVFRPTPTYLHIAYRR
jgi:hypothetical protein